MAQSIKPNDYIYFDASGVAYLLGANLRTVLQRYNASASTFTIDAPRESDNDYSFGIMFGAPGGTSWFCYLIWLRSASVGTDPNVPYVLKINGGANAVAFTGTYSGSTTSGKITLTADQIVYGGIRVLWLA